MSFSEYPPVGQPLTPDLRAADADRDRVAAELREHVGEGRLTLEEFSARIDAAYEARTLGELETLTRDLPAAGSHAPATMARPTRRPTRRSIAVMSGIARKSRWRIEERTTAIAVMGGIELDLRAAEIEGAEVEITAIAVMGGIEITVPEGVEVDLTGFAFMGGKEESVKEVPRIPGAPLVRVRAFAVMGAVEVRSRPAEKRSIGP